MLTIETLKTATPREIDEISSLLPMLSKDFSQKTVDPDLLKSIVNSPYHEQLVARLDGSIVGIATLSMTMGVGAGKKCYLEDFVVSSNHRGLGIGTRLWQEIANWCARRNTPLHFTSRSSRVEAHKFYLKHGATIYDTDVFHFTPNSLT